MSTVFNFTFVPWFRSVAPYIHKFRDKTFVVGLTGEAIAAGKLHSIAQDLALIQAMGVKIVLVHGFRPQVNEQLQAKGHAAQLLARHAHHRLGGARLRAGGRRPAALRDRGRLQPGPAEHADGRLDGARDLGQLHHRAARWASSTAWISSTRAWCARSMSPASAARSTSARMVLISPFGFSPTGEAFNLDAWKRSPPAWPSRSRPTS